MDVDFAFDVDRIEIVLGSTIRLYFGLAGRLPHEEQMKAGGWVWQQRCYRGCFVGGWRAE